MAAGFNKIRVSRELPRPNIRRFETLLHICCANPYFAITFPLPRDERHRPQFYPENSGPWNRGTAPLDHSIQGNYLNRTIKVGQHNAIVTEVSVLHLGSSPNGFCLATHNANLTAYRVVDECTPRRHLRPNWSRIFFIR